MNLTQLSEQVFTKWFLSIVPHPPILQVAHQAFAAHQKGISTGNWADFLLLMSDDIEFHAPSPYLPEGWIRSKTEVATLLQRVTQELYLSAQLTLLYPPVANQDTVAFECLAKEDVAGRSQFKRLVLFYEIEVDKIKRFREYIS